MCVLALYTQYFPEFCEQKTGPGKWAKQASVKKDYGDLKVFTAKIIIFFQVVLLFKIKL